MLRVCISQNVRAECDISGCCRYIPKTRCRSFDIKYAGDSAGKGWAEGGQTRKLERAVVRDSKGWRIDRRRSVTRYSCQQAAGITSPPLSHLPFPPLSHPLAGPSTLSFVRYGCRVTQEYFPRKCSIDVFSATRPFDGNPRSRFHPSLSRS